MARRRLPLIVLSVAVVLTAVGLGLSWTSDAARSERERAARLEDAMASDRASTAKAAVAAVDAIRVERTNASVVVDVAVTLEALRTVAVGAEVSGRVVEIGVEEHERVSEGDVLVRLDSAFSEAAVAQARAALLQARSGYALATQEHGRQRSLSGEGISSVAEFDSAYE